MKKLPFYFYLIFWISSIALAIQFEKKFPDLSDLFAFIVFIIPIAFSYFWILKNKNKIFRYYKKIRIRFRHVFYTIESLVCVLIISLIVSLISLGGYKNLKEKVLFEYIVWNDKSGLVCSPNGIAYKGYGKYSRYYFKAHTQFLDYFQFKPYSFVKEVYALKDESLFNFNHCKATRILLKEAHKGNQVAKDMLAAYPTSFHMIYEINDEYLFWRYVESLNKKKLYNPALVYIDTFNAKEGIEGRIKNLKEAGEEGYLLAMEDYLLDVAKDFDLKIHKDECPFILKYSEHLSQQKYIMADASKFFSLMGITSWSGSKLIYECTNKKVDFAKAIILINDFYIYLGQKDTSRVATVYPALIYFNGWGSVPKDQELAIELFLKNMEDKNPSKISKAYLSLNELNNYKNGMELLNEIIDSEVTTYQALRYIYCDNIKYNFKIITKVYKETKQEKQSRITKYLEPLKSCLNNSSREEGIKSVQSYIKSWIENRFKNPELVKTLNLYG